jgi:hypothetical protein
MSLQQRASELQSLVNNPLFTPEMSTTLLQLELADMNKLWDPEPKRVVRANQALFVDDQTTLDALLYPSQTFGETCAIGYVPRISCIHYLGKYLLTFPFVQAKVIGPEQELEDSLLDLELADEDVLLPLHTPLRRPLHIPLVDIRFFEYAA